MDDTVVLPIKDNGKHVPCPKRKKLGAYDVMVGSAVCLRHCECFDGRADDKNIKCKSNEPK